MDERDMRITIQLEFRIGHPAVATVANVNKA
ncbi:hypothetical protein TNIN_357441, partial [Trichonephila inaurata madagascariensis]